MAIPQRTLSITGVFAENAATTIPTPPVPGAAYRDTALTPAEAREGWPYKEIVDSSKFNQAMYEYSAITQMIEKYGFLPWSPSTNYVQGALALGTDGNIYQAKQNTGPSSTAYNPVNDTNHTYWDNWLNGILGIIFPVGSVYEGTQPTCPMQSLISGSTWTLRATKIVTDVNSTVAVKGNGKGLGIVAENPNGATVWCGRTDSGGVYSSIYRGEYTSANIPTKASSYSAVSNYTVVGVTADAARSGLTGTASSTTFAVNIWERTA